MDPKTANKILNKVKEDFDEIAEKFAQTREKIQPEILFLKNYITDGENVLDIGCGSGRLYKLFSDKRIYYFGVDFSKRLIDIAKRKYLPDPTENKEESFDKTFPTFLRVNALSLPFEDGFFDKIFCIAVLHHIPSEEKRIEFLKEIKRVLRRRGELHLTVWNLWTRKYIPKILKEGIKKLFGKSKLDYCDIFIPFDRKTQRYYHCFRKGELKRIFKKAGFQIKEIKKLKRGRRSFNIYARLKN